MLRFLADENFDHRIVRGLIRRNPLLDILTVQAAGLRGESDPNVLEFAAKQERVLLTHDVNTMRIFLRTRLAAGLRTPGVFEVPDGSPLGRVIENLLLLAEASIDGEWDDQLIRIPL